jgi:hypothetical protein
MLSAVPRTAAMRCQTCFLSYGCRSLSGEVRKATKG